MGGLKELLVQRHVKEGEGAAGDPDVVAEGVGALVPVLPHGKDRLAGEAAQGVQPIAEKGEADVLGRVDAKAVHPGLI